jgi:alkylated DNA repair dioxygenase AlkB
MAAFVPRYAITFGEVAILHVGGAQFGAARAGGFTVAELRAIAADHPDETELVMVSDALPAGERAANEAAVLVFRHGAELLGVDPDDLLQEQRNVPYDRKYWDTRRGKTLNKRARYNVVFGDQGQAHSDDYRDPTVQAFAGVPLLEEIRERLAEVLGPKAAGLSAEGNYYYEPASGIGYHGDAERWVVICLSLGGASVLRYHWRTPGSTDHVLPPVDIRVGHGDIYVMSEKATGHDWLSRSKTRVVHAAGSAKYAK